MDSSVVFLFSGQGSQYYHMGKNLYLNNPVFRNSMDKLDKMIKKITGTSVLGVLYNENVKKSETFNSIQYTHPSIFMVEYSIAQVFIEMNIYPDYVLGTSLGEFASCAIAGVMSCEEILECIIEQAKMIEKNCCRGGMLTIVNDHKLYFENRILNENSQIVAINYNSHFVVSGRIDGLKEIESHLKNKGILYLRLPVLFGFHSSFIDSAALSYNNFLASKIYSQPRTNVISCTEGNKVTSFSKSYFWDVIRKKIDFPSALKSISDEEKHIYIDLGPSGTLANFTKYNLSKASKSSIHSVITPFNNEINNLEKLLILLGR
ncbi:acyltransferase domain-containing protein [Clostridium estertheticum]|uniref:acyltransferase domain-containing protein n=1 Tax=Clostridium estertheticum TaxID=238834 RepID=UPI001CF48FD1|nr:acyltransferase domain-containing protein [Clostridium estertheticum]MCB2360152.1 acyltransferase domain-containing protein [Clostridium estertheticum]